MTTGETIKKILQPGPRVYPLPQETKDMQLLLDGGADALPLMRRIRKEIADRLKDLRNNKLEITRAELAYDVCTELIAYYKRDTRKDNDE